MTDVPPMQPSAEARIVGKANLSVLEHAASNGGDASGFRLDFLTNCHMRDAVTEAYRDGYNAACAEIAALTEQRDRAMAVVAMAREWTRYPSLAAQLLKDTVAAFDTPSSPSLPESPEMADRAFPLPPPQCRL